MHSTVNYVMAAVAAGLCGEPRCVFLDACFLPGGGGFRRWIDAGRGEDGNAIYGTMHYVIGTVAVAWFFGWGQGCV